MLDTHLIQVALTVFGITAGTAILIAVAIIALAGIRQHAMAARRVVLAGARTADRREPALR